MPDTEIKRVTEQLPVQRAPSILDMMQQVVSRENPQDMAGALEQLVRLKEHVEDRDARKEFFQAFARAQAKLQTVVATMAVPDKQGNIRWFVCPFADILDAIEPVLRDEGFSVRFDSEREGPMLTAYCYAMHQGGHQERAACHFNAANAQGGDLGALTSAKRGALMEMFALKIRRSDDARLLGDFIDPDEVVELQTMIAQADNVPMPQFMQYAGGVKKLEDIRKGKLPQLRTWLKRRLSGKSAQTVTTPDAEPEPPAAAPQLVTAEWCRKFCAGVATKRKSLETSLGNEEFISAVVCDWTGNSPTPLEELTQASADKMAGRLKDGDYCWETGERIPPPADEIPY